MDSLGDLRAWLFRFRKRYFRKQAKDIPPSPGLPSGIDLSEIQTIFRDHFGGKIASITHQHLSGWKSSGAYRLSIHTTKGTDTSLIFKNACYSRDEIPALSDFPLEPGYPEYLIYRHASAPLVDFLPRIYLVEEVIPRGHYRYVLEDLQNHYSIRSGDEAKIHLSTILPRLHEALRDWADRIPSRQFLRYGMEFSQALQHYAFVHLSNYSQQTDDRVLKEVLAAWEAITEVHTRPEFFLHPSQLIHGDTNYTNIHVAMDDTQRFKVVDWEWAGFNNPYADLASLLKGGFSTVEKESIEQFAANTFLGGMGNNDISTGEAHRLFLWASLERGMIDSAFLAAQSASAAADAQLDFPLAISQSATRMLTSYRRLAN